MANFQTQRHIDWQKFHRPDIDDYRVMVLFLVFSRGVGKYAGTGDYIGGLASGIRELISWCLQNRAQICKLLQAQNSQWTVVQFAVEMGEEFVDHLVDGPEDAQAVGDRLGGKTILKQYPNVPCQPVQRRVATRSWFRWWR